MSPRVLIGIHGIPDLRGPNAGAYRLFQNLQRDGVDVGCMNLIEAELADYARFRIGEGFGNPRELAGVTNCFLGEPWLEAQASLERAIREFAPDLLIATDAVSTLLMKRAAPGLRLVLLQDGLAQVDRYLAARWCPRRFTLDEFRRRARGGSVVFDAIEREALERADLIISNSEMVRELTSELLPDARGKLYSRVIWHAEWIADDARPYAELAQPFAERDIDVIFAADSWRSPSEGLATLRKIVSRCAGRSIHVVGTLRGGLHGAHCHGPVQDQEAFFALLGRSKTLACPARFASAPAELWQASVMGCNVIASSHCGNVALCHADLIAQAETADDFSAAIERSLVGKLDDRMQSFLEAESYRDLLDTFTLEGPW